MSIAPIEMKSSKRLSNIGCGTHLCTIMNLYYLTNAAKEYILADNKHKIMVVVFANDWKKDKEKKTHEQHYVIDGGWRQDQFKSLMLSANVVADEEGNAPKVKDAIGKRLWLSIKSVHTVNDGIPVIEDGEPLIEYFIFKMHPYIDNGKKPKLSGDPEDNDGVPSGEFISYNNISLKTDKPVVQEAKKETPTISKDIDLDEVPQF